MAGTVKQLSRCGPSIAGFLLPSGLQLSGYTNPNLALVCYTLGVLGLLWPAYHWVADRKGKVNPSILISAGVIGVVAFGLLAMAGLIWQFRFPAGATTALSAVVSDITATQPPELAQQRTPPALTFPIRSPRDADNEITVIDQLLAMLRESADPLIARGAQLSNYWWGSLHEPGGIERYESDQTTIGAFLGAYGDGPASIQGKLRSLKVEHEPYFINDIEKIIDESSFSNTKDAFLRLSNAYGSTRYLVERLSPPNDDDRQLEFSFARLMEPTVTDFNQKMRDFDVKLSKIKAALLSRRDELSKMASAQR